MAGPYQDPPLANLQCAEVGVVPKKDGAWRMIMHLSAPQQGSINEGIDKETYSLCYSNIYDATWLIVAVGKGCYLAKVDLKSTSCTTRLGAPWHPLEATILRRQTAPFWAALSSFSI